MWLRLCCALPNVSSVVKSRNPHTIHEQHQYSRLDKLHGHIPHLNAAAKLPWWQYGRLRDGSGPVAKTSLLYQALLPDSFIDFLFPLHLLFLFGHGATVVCIAHSPLHALPPFPSLHTSYRRLWCLSATVVISAVVSLSVTSYSLSLFATTYSQLRSGYPQPQSGLQQIAVGCWHSTPEVRALDCNVSPFFSSVPSLVEGTGEESPL